MAVTIDDFVFVMEEASQINLEQFKLWYSQSGTPEVKMVRSYNEKLKQLEITFEQNTLPDKNQDIKKPFHIPINFEIIDSNSDKKLIELRNAKETFIFNNIAKDSLPSIFRQFSAPVKIKTDFNSKEIAFLMANDTDEFNRWDAAQTLFIKELKQLINCMHNNKTLSVSLNLINAFKKALTNPKTDRAFLSKALSLPLETEIKDHFNIIDVNSIHSARVFLKQEFAKQLKNEFLDVIDLCSKSDVLSLSHNAMADRSLKNLALSYLGSLKENETTALVLKHYESAKNMTDELAGFKILTDIDSDIKSKAVEKFYLKWKKDKLVLDKWFAVQAGSALPDTLDIVESLIKHPDFSIKNPNKVRSLIYIFAMQNQINFHQDNGAGYKFIADKIIDLDSINPQVAARLSSCFNHWKKYDAQRKFLMKTQLERILSVQNLSKNVYEIISNTI
jgi:aminopeptidase N